MDDCFSEIGRAGDDRGESDVLSYKERNDSGNTD
jgi:hypothetical protein